ncbi:ubiquitin carboxyl-terminal hydrolase 8 isoform X2 [Thrips palmi]|uniref:Ubiquitin carboxyl-terminal hydrolase n=1 Tax=Thrips palmi TaxID=161013 RepID=A0A6P8YX45_THRPL|nr:ubiquitin carboxyl-terminal hydrolase 8 isoform X2 [Thrips palmi]
MSAPSLKPLVKGKCLQDLKEHYDKEFPNKNIVSLCKSAPKLFEAAKIADKKGNQEESYILFMRYLNITSYVQKSNDYKLKKPHVELSKSALNYAITSAERLNKSLEERYQQLKNNENAALERSKVKVETSKEEPSIIENVPAPTAPEINENNSMSTRELFKILQENPSDALIMDVRPRNQFSDSHINFECCISIPEEIIQAGSSAAKLAEKLPPPSKLKWSNRTQVKYLVLMDWYSSSSKLKDDSPIHRLQTIILKWDPSVTYCSKPLILEGGFEEWHSCYPMYCTNANPQLPIQPLDDLLDIDDVNYPDIDDTPKFSRETKPVLKQNIIITDDTSKEKVYDINKNEELSANRYVSPGDEKKVPSTQKTTSLISKEPSTSSINSHVPNIDRSSKTAAVQKYKELEDKRLIGVQLAQNLVRDREAAESELMKLRQQQGRNELSDKERQTLYENEKNLKEHIQELISSQIRKDEENEALRKELEEYKRRENSTTQVHEVSKPPIVPARPGEIKSFNESEKPNVVKHRLAPGTPTGATNTDLSMPSANSGLKRSRSSPNIAQLIHEPEPKPLPQFDRNTKPLIQRPPNQEFMNRNRNFHEVYGTVKPGLTGLKNLGNSCYMNSILQCISNINVLNNYFSSLKYKDDINRSPHNPTRGEVAEEVGQVIRHLWLGQYRSIACRDLKAVVGKYMDQFRGSGQQDAHEFLTFLMDWLHNDLKIQKEELGKELSVSKKNADVDAITGAINAWNIFRSKHESFMLTGFFIQQVSTVQCCSCSAKSMNYEEPTSNLTLLLPSAARCTLSDCLRLYTSKERIAGYKCESCHGLHDAEKSVDLCRLPPTLIIHLKRFYSDGFYQKRQTFVDFPLENLDMKIYTPNRHQSHTVYDLCGVSNHYGTLEGGHYTAYCKNGNKWYKYDDQDVSEISREDVRSANAYILFYAAVR